MNPMEFFHKKNGFPFQDALSQPHVNPESLQGIKDMVKQYQTILNDDFWGEVNGLRKHKTKNEPVLPIEIWENDENIYLLVVSPGLPDLQHAQIFFENDYECKLKIKTNSLMPKNDVTLLSTELPQQFYEREISIGKAVDTSDYSSSYEDGLLTYKFQKAKNTIDIPIDF
ncbi:HSP20 family molecular chaperone IbpA [Metabacillus crassostreae]|uniref:Hsp20 family protein n=1 Tax=Metabacillus crassostreae TaxID=929098 RepID=UPI0019581926|nr:hypothetical protein [Metabacillus crassostreae]MBM7603017.1 HSP20 family molecular chaperone IbpA [Metabacillus crassostreae]